MNDKLTYLYPGCFDPITLGHEHIAKRAAQLCHRLVVAVASSANRNDFLFDQSQRIELCAQVLAVYKNIDVVPLDGLVVDCAHQHHASVIVKGVRDSQDYLRESHMAYANRRLGQGLETLLLPSLPEYTHISSSLVRELARYANADLGSFVPAAVAQRLRQRS